MDGRDYLQLVSQTLSTMEITIQCLRTAVNTLYEHATFDPHKKFVVQSTEVKMIEAIKVMSLENMSAKLMEAGSTGSPNKTLRDSLIFQG